MPDDAGANNWQETEAAVRKFIRGCEEGSLELMGAVIAEDCVAWHNTDNLVLTGEVGMSRISAFRASLADLRYEGTVLHPTPTGAVIQTTLVLTAKNGTRVEVPASSVLTVREGLIRRWDDYYDSAPFAKLFA